MIGVYASHAEALDAIARLKLKPGFAEIPEIVLSGQDAAEGFFVDEYEVGKDHWIEGFVTV
ncbi:MAG: hypothetical protein DHS20C04_27960 [Hyphococcus sp.]|nr:MAG: hypothetical protein DHS20C04_27960 [Marinicaulis sp.]